MGDIHPGGNPHYMVDPRAVAAVAGGIAERLAELDPAHADAYLANAAGFVRRLESARKGWEARMAVHRGAAIISYHKTLSYLVDWLRLEEVGFLEPKPGIPPNPAHVARVLSLARARKVRVMVQEERYPESTSRLVADKIPATLVRIPGGTDLQHGQRYVDYVGQVVERIAAGLEKARGQ
jgi:zinc/manganese transport system substrate-binding protein